MTKHRLAGLDCGLPEADRLWWCRPRPAPEPVCRLTDPPRGASSRAGSGAAHRRWHGPPTRSTSSAPAAGLPPSTSFGSTEAPEEDRLRADPGRSDHLRDDLKKRMERGENLAAALSMLSQWLDEWPRPSDPQSDSWGRSDPRAFANPGTPTGGSRRFGGLLGRSRAVCPRSLRLQGWCLPRDGCTASATRKAQARQRCRGLGL